jgi:predicted small lipoprotein YifL
MRFERTIVLCLAAGALLGCGQKGPLYLPDRTGAVITRPGPDSNTPPSQPQTAPTPVPSESAPETPPVTDSTTDDSSSQSKEPKPK